MDTYRFQEFEIPAHMLDAIKRYIFKHQPVGHFLTAVICNDLNEAVSRADAENLRNLPAYPKFFYNEAPSPCWGTKEKMEKWLSEPPTGREQLETPE